MPNRSSGLLKLSAPVRLILHMFLLFCLSCGGGKKALLEPVLPEGELLSSKSAIVLILPETYLAGGSARKITLHEREKGGEIVLELRAQDAAQLKALYLQLEYDAAQLSPAGVDSEWRFAEQDDSLQLSLASAPGVLEYGEQCLRPAEPSTDGGRKGFDGDGLLATIKLARRPFTPLQREVTAPTIAQRSQSILSLDVDTFTLNWGYASNGDYNQNGTVAVTDLTPIGAHFGEDVPDEDQSTIQAVIDGNGDGTIGVADLTAIGLNFRISVLSYNIYAANNIEAVPTSNGGPNGAGAELRGSVNFSNVQGDQFSARRSFSFVLPVSQIGWFYWVRPNDAEGGSGADGTPSGVVSFGGKSDNLDPLAVISAEPASGGRPLEVALDASGSSDPDGAAGDISDIVQFQWDFDGNGVVDDVTTEPAVTHTYRNFGLRQARVTVFDARAAFASASTTIGVGVQGNNTPTALLEASLSSGEAPMTVIFDASGSTDGDEDKFSLKHEWDFDGDGIFDLDTGFTSFTTHTYMQPGLFDATLRVRDEVDQIATTSVAIDVQPNQGNQPPVAVLLPDPLEADVTSPSNGLIATFDISQCTDADGSIARADLDANSDGFVDATFVSVNGSVPTSLNAFARVGVNTATLTVLDNLGAQTIVTSQVRVSVDGNLPPIPLLEADVTSGDTPLSVNLDATGSSDPDGSISSFNFRINTEAEFTDADGLLTLNFENSGTFFVQLRLVDDGGLERFARIVITVSDPDNQPPSAAFTLNKTSGQAPLTVTFDPSASQDSDGSIASYDWDFNGDGIFDRDDSLADSASFERSFMTAGETDISLRVVDNDGASDVTTQTITVSGGWEFGTIATGFKETGISSYQLSLAALPTTEPGQRKAGLAYFHGDLEQLSSILYTECDPANPLAWSTPVPVAAFEEGTQANGAFGLEAALVDAAGHPGIAIEGAVFVNGQATTSGILFTRASDPQGSSWPLPVTVVEGNVSEPSIALVDGHPALCARTFANNTSEIVYSRANDPTGSSWGSAALVYSPLPGEIVSRAHLLVPADAVPGIVFSAGPAGDEGPFYSRAFDSLGLGWDARQVIEDGTDRNFFTRNKLMAAVANGHPTAIFSDGSNRLFVERSNSVLGDYAAPSLELGRRSTGVAAMASAGGRPCLVYASSQFDPHESGETGVLYFQVAADQDATAWEAPVSVLFAPFNTITVALFKRINDDLVIVFNDQPSETLKVAVFENFVGL